MFDLKIINDERVKRDTLNFFKMIIKNIQKSDSAYLEELKHSHKSGTAKYYKFVLKTIKVSDKEKAKELSDKGYFKLNDDNSYIDFDLLLTLLETLSIKLETEYNETKDSIEYIINRYAARNTIRISDISYTQDNIVY